MPMAKVITAGTLVVFFEGYGSAHTVRIETGKIFNCKAGNFWHDDIIGKNIGCKVADRKSGKWLAVLNPSSELVAMSLKHRTQILYHTDISVILTLLDVKPGDVVVESGTGTGTLTLALGRAVAPKGRVMSFEYHSTRLEAARLLFADLELSEVIKLTLRNVVANGFSVDQDSILRTNCASAICKTSTCDTTVQATDDLHCSSEVGYADSVFLDLPRPFDVVAHSARCLKTGGRFVSFSPCVEQVQKTAEQLRKHEFQEIRTLEVLCKPWRSLKSAAECRARSSVPYKHQGHRKSIKRRRIGAGPDTYVRRGDEESNQNGVASDDVDAQSGCAESSRMEVTRETSVEAEGGEIAKLEDEPSMANGDDCVSQRRISKPAHHCQMSMRAHTGYLVFATLYKK